MLAHASRFQAGYVLMHAQGTPKTMQDSPNYEDVVKDVRAFFDNKFHIIEELKIPNFGSIRV